MNFYTGIQTVEMFNVSLMFKCFIKPYFPDIVYWTTPAKHSDFNKNKKALSHKELKEIDTKGWIPVNSHEISSRNT